MSPIFWGGGGGVGVYIANMIPESPLNKIVQLTVTEDQGGGGGGGGLHR